MKLHPITQSHLIALRDELARDAMKTEIHACLEKEISVDFRLLAEWSYNVADAMIAEREQRILTCYTGENI